MATHCGPISWLNPVLLDGPGPLDLRWYALAYIFGLILAWRYLLGLQRNTSLWHTPGTPKPASPFSKDDIDELLFLATLGVLIGGRLGYVLFYMGETRPGWWREEWAFLTPFKLWDGGMSFHGGLLGVAVAMAWLGFSRKLPILRIADGGAAAAPIGLFLGRCANFINGELYGRASDAPWAMRFRCENDKVPFESLPTRHPSQLYEAALEGIVLFVILRFFTHRMGSLSRPGLTTGLFLLGYGIFRSLVENFREPDKGLENLPFGVTMGMILSAPMWLGGAYLVWRAWRSPPAGAPAQGAA